MVKLGDNETNEAWENFKAFLIQMGYLKVDPNHPNNLVNGGLAQLAFKHGFVEGSNIEDAEPEPELKKRNYNGKRFVRPFNVRHMDRKELEKYLVERGGPVELSEIIAEMNKLGADHWNSNNASAYVKTAIKDGARIAKIKMGVYQHQSTISQERRMQHV